MKKLLEMLKKELNKNWASELDALGTTHGLIYVRSGQSSYYAMRNDLFELHVERERRCIRVKYTVYDEFEERDIRVSYELFDRFVKALETYAKETEKERMFNHYRRDIEQMIDREVSKRMRKTKGQKPAGDMVEH